MDKNNLTTKLNSASDVINKLKTQTPPPVNTKEALSARFSKFVSSHPNLIINKDGKQYLKAEAWQFLLSQMGVMASCDCIAMIHRELDKPDDFVGVKVEVTLIRISDGMNLGKSMMVARCDEEWLKDKPDYAVYGMAQTRAISRAARNVYGWVAIQAGFEATPWDEMQAA